MLRNSMREIQGQDASFLHSCLPGSTSGTGDDGSKDGYAYEKHDRAGDKHTEATGESELDKISQLNKGAVKLILFVPGTKVNILNKLGR